MLNEGDQSWVVRNLDRLAPDLHGLSPTKKLALSTPTLQQMLETTEPVVIPDTYQYPTWETLETSPWIASYAGAPLCIQNEVLGFLNMNSDQVNYFNQEIIPRLEAFAATAAAAIQNARLYSDLQAHSLELEERVSERTVELSAAKERIETILKAVPDAVFVLDVRYQLVQANPAGESLQVMAEQEGLDLFVLDFLTPLIEGSVSEEKAILEVQGRAYQALASPIPNPEFPSGVVVVFRDVTRFRELDQMKTRFVSDVSHELRTPLANLSIYLDLLTTVKDEQRSREYLATLQRETERLTHLIEDLLTISRLEAGRIVIDIQPVDVVGLVQNLAEDRAPMATQQKLSLSHSTAPGLPYAHADPRLLSQVLSNLLTNAFNYTPAHGSIHLHTDMVQGADGCWITISIQDNGVGILPSEMDNLFVRFFRGSASYSTASSGTGLGLAISKEIIDRLNGLITVESQPNQGSNFIVWIKAV
jgi:signal transduction histidine kinase